MTEMTTIHTPKGIELMAFRIGAQEFCIGIVTVREIRGWTPATALPHSPGFVRGVINLRGAVLPIVDLAARLGLEFGRADVAARHHRGAGRKAAHRSACRRGV